MKSGFVSFIGRPNVGKSTLLNSILNKKVVITSNKPQTTRNLIQGIYNEDDTQIIFVDTPGIHKAHNKLGRALNKQAYFTINDVDIIIMVVDITEKVGSGDKFVIDILKNIENKPVFLVINKIDKLPREEILSKIEEYMSLYNFTEVIPVSARKKDNIDRLIEVIKNIYSNIKYFDSDTVTNSSPEFIISELIREKVLELTDEEVPHSVTCIVDELYEEEKIINIGASIIVDRENLKKIIIGKNGNMIKEIGIRARKDIEEYFGKQVYLDLFVKVIPKWRDKEKFLNMIGYKDFLNK